MTMESDGVFGNQGQKKSDGRVRGFGVRQPKVGDPEPGLEDTHGEQSVVPTFLTLKDAAPKLGWASADALRMAFRSGRLPLRFLIRMGRACRVDLCGLVQWLRARAQLQEAAQRPAAEGA